MSRHLHNTAVQWCVASEHPRPIIDISIEYLRVEQVADLVQVDLQVGDLHKQHAIDALCPTGTTWAPGNEIEKRADWRARALTPLCGIRGRRHPSRICRQRCLARCVG